MRILSKVCMISLVSCLACVDVDYSEDVHSILAAKRKFLFLQAHSATSSPRISDYCDIGVYDLDSRRFVLLTNDRAYDFAPAWFRGGSSIIFVSARQGAIVDKVVSAYPKARKLFYANEDTLICLSDIDGFESLSKFQNLDLVATSGKGEHIFFCDSQNRIYRYDPITKLSPLMDLGSGFLIGDLQISPNDSLLAIEATSLDSSPRGSILIFGVDDRSTVWKVEGSPSIRFGGWSPDGRKIIYLEDEKILAHSLTTNTDEPISIPGMNSEFWVDQVCFAGLDTLILSAGRIDSVSSNENSALVPGELALFDLNANRMEWLLVNGLHKSQIRFYWP